MDNRLDCQEPVHNQNSTSNLRKIRLPFNSQLMPLSLKSDLRENLKRRGYGVEFVEDAFKKPNSIDVFMSDWTSSFPDVEFATLAFRPQNLFWFKYCGYESFLANLDRAAELPRLEREQRFAESLESLEDSGCAFPISQMPTRVLGRNVLNLKFSKYRQEYFLSDILEAPKSF